MKSLKEIRSRTNKARADLLLTDAETALTFLDSAEITRIEEHRIRSREQAVKALRFIREQSDRVDLSPQQRKA